MDPNVNNSLPSPKGRNEEFSLETSSNVNVASGSTMRSLRPAPEQEKPEYWWENITNEAGGQWQSLHLVNLPENISEMSDKCKSECSSKQLLNSDKTFRSKAEVGGFRSYGDYRKAVEKHNAYWCKFYKRDARFSDQLNCSSDDVENFTVTTKDPKSYGSTSVSSCTDDKDRRQSIKREPQTSPVVEISGRWEFVGNPNLSRREKPTTKPGKNPKLATRHGEDVFRSFKGRESRSSNSGALFEPSKENKKLKKGTCCREAPLKSSQPKNLPKSLKSFHCSPSPSSAPVPQPRSRRALLSESEIRKVSKFRPSATENKTCSSKLHSCNIRTLGDSSHLSKESIVSNNSVFGKQPEHPREALVPTTPGTARKRWVKTPRKDKISLGNCSADRFASGQNSEGEISSDTSLFSSVRKLKNVLKTSIANGVWNEEGSSSSTGTEKVGPPILPKRLRIFEDCQSEDSKNKKLKTKMKQSSGKEIRLDSVSMAKIKGLRREIASLKSLINSKKTANARVSTDTMTSERALDSPFASSNARHSCKETCSLISAYQTILFSQECFCKKLESFDELLGKKLTGDTFKGSFQPTSCSRENSVDGLDGKTKSVYVIGKSPSDASSRKKAGQHSDAISSPKLLSYRCVEQTAADSSLETRTVENSTQTELSFPVNFSDTRRSVGIQCDRERETKLEKVDKDSNTQALWKLGPENALGLTFKSTCNVLEIPHASYAAPLQRKSKFKETCTSPADTVKKTASFPRNLLLNRKASERTSFPEVPKRTEESTQRKLKKSSCENSGQTISLEFWSNPQISPSQRSPNSCLESVDEVDEQLVKSPSKGPSKKKSKLMTATDTEAAVESKVENPTKQKNGPSFSGASCNFSKKSCHRRRLQKSVAKPTPFKLARSE